MMVRADASAEIGSGHVMRCLALAQAWRRAGGETTFALAASTPAIEARVRQGGFDVHRLNSAASSAEDAAETAGAAGDAKASWIAADGYSFDTVYRRSLRSGGARLLVVDDEGSSGPYEADLVLNHNVYAREDLYPRCEGGPYFLLGPRFALLREEFGAWREKVREIPATARRVLITLGGADPTQSTLPILRATATAPEIEIVAVFSGGHAQRAELEALAAGLSGRVRVVCDATNMPELMAWADVAIAGAGVTAMELAFLGVPALLLVLAANQIPVAKGFQAQGAAIDLGDARAFESEAFLAVFRRVLDSHGEREAMSRAGRALVDGRGGERIVAAMDAFDIYLRAAQPGDARLLWEWANDPEVRAASFQSTAIPWPDHERWLAQRLADPQSRIFIAETSGREPCGVVRFALGGSQAVISVSTDARFRGLGCGPRVITAGCRQLFAETGIESVLAEIRPDNVRSVRAFQIAGFREETTPGPHGGLSLCLSRP